MTRSPIELLWTAKNLKSIEIGSSSQVITGGKQFPLQNSGYLTCAIHSDQNEFVTIGGADLTNGGATHGKVDRCK